MRLLCTAAICALAGAAGAAAAVVESAKLTGAGEAGAGEFGNSLALSANGRTALIGGRNDRSLIGALEGFRVHSQAIGAAWVFRRTGEAWRPAGKKLTASGERGPGGFGNGVALSADGNVALIGGPSGYGGIGAAWIFTRSESTWRQQARLIPRGISQTSGYVTDPTGFGASVALSADGRIALVGGPTADHGVGAVWIFTRSGSRWQQGPKLTGSGVSGIAQFGQTVALSAAGDTALVGAPTDANGVGAVWTFVRSGSSWKPLGGKLTPHGTSGYARFGYALALSVNGTTALVGSPVDHDGVGAAWVFTRAGSGWTQEEKLTAGDENGLGQLGDSVALSAAGTAALVGGAYDANGVGAAWLFRREGSKWKQQGGKLTGRGAVGQAPLQFGAAVALTRDGRNALVAGTGDGEGAGAVWPFRFSD